MAVLCQLLQNWVWIGPPLRPEWPRLSLGGERDAHGALCPQAAVALAVSLHQPPRLSHWHHSRRRGDHVWLLSGITVMKATPLMPARWKRFKSEGMAEHGGTCL